jgi:hypothetical protein
MKITFQLIHKGVNQKIIELDDISVVNFNIFIWNKAGN